MSKHTDDMQVINTNRASNPVAALLDAATRSEEALVAFPQFFTDEHMDRVKNVKQVLQAFFPIHKRMHVNHRANRGKPFTVVKAESIQFPRVSQKAKQERYLKPIQDLGGEIVYSKTTNSVLVRIHR